MGTAPTRLTFCGSKVEIFKMRCKCLTCTLVYFTYFRCGIHPANDLVCLKFLSLNNFAVVIAVIVKRNGKQSFSHSSSSIGLSFIRLAQETVR